MDIVGNTETQKTKSGGNKFEDMNKSVQSEKDLTEDEIALSHRPENEDKLGIANRTMGLNPL